MAFPALPLRSSINTADSKLPELPRSPWRISPRGALPGQWRIRCQWQTFSLRACNCRCCCWTAHGIRQKLFTSTLSVTTTGRKSAVIPADGGWLQLAGCDCPKVAGSQRQRSEFGHLESLHIAEHFYELLLEIRDL